MVKERSRRKESREISDYLKKLELADIKEFKLIEDQPDAVSIFIENSDEAEYLRKQIQNILKNKKMYFAIE